MHDKLIKYRAVEIELKLNPDWVRYPNLYWLRIYDRKTGINSRFSLKILADDLQLFIDKDLVKVVLSRLAQMGLNQLNQDKLTARTATTTGFIFLFNVN